MPDPASSKSPCFKLHVTVTELHYQQCICQMSWGQCGPIFVNLKLSYTYWDGKPTVVQTTDKGYFSGTTLKLGAVCSTDNLSPLCVQ